MRCLILILLAMTTFLSLQLLAQEMDEAHVREELGVNAYTSPAVADLLDALGLLGEIPFASVKREVPLQHYPVRAQLALNFGGLVADAFLIVAAERTGNAEAVARGLLRYAKALAVSNTVTRHAESLSELVAKENWPDLRKELIAMQGDIEKAFMSLKDEEIAHLISLGGWIRALEICARTASIEYTPKRASQLVQPELMDYFQDRMQTLQPKLKEMPLFQKLTADLQRVKATIDQAGDETLSKAQVKEVLSIAREMNEAILKPVQ